VKRITLFYENIRVAFKAIRSSRVRAVLTMAIIAFGIMALVGILTAIDGLKSTLTEQFTMMGANVILDNISFHEGADRQPAYTPA